MFNLQFRNISQQRKDGLLFDRNRTWRAYTYLNRVRNSMDRSLLIVMSCNVIDIRMIKITLPKVIELYIPK